MPAQALELPTELAVWVALRCKSGLWQLNYALFRAWFNEITHLALAFWHKRNWTFWSKCALDMKNDVCFVPSCYTLFVNEYSCMKWQLAALLCTQTPPITSAIFVNTCITCYPFGMLSGYQNARLITFKQLLWRLTIVQSGDPCKESTVSLVHLCDYKKHVVCRVDVSVMVMVNNIQKSDSKVWILQSKYPREFGLKGPQFLIVFL